MDWSQSETTARLEAALSKAGVPPELHKEFIRFQQRYGGTRDALGTWGIIHKSPTWLPKKGIEAEWDQDDEIWHVACQDVHPSFYMSIDEHGRLYCGYQLRYEHYDDAWSDKPADSDE